MKRSAKPKTTIAALNSHAGLYDVLKLGAMTLGAALLLLPSFIGSAAAEEKPQASKADNFTQLEFRAHCTPFGGSLRIINRGDRWPDKAEVKLFREGVNKPVAERILLLGKGQQFSYLVKNHHLEGKRYLLQLNPRWHDKKNSFGTSISCG